MKNHGTIVYFVIALLMLSVAFGQTKKKEIKNEQPRCSQCEFKDNSDGNSDGKKADEKPVKKSGRNFKKGSQKANVDTPVSVVKKEKSVTGGGAIFKAPELTQPVIERKIRTTAFLEGRGIFSTFPKADFAQFNGEVSHRITRPWKHEIGIFGSFSASKALIDPDSTYANVLAGFYYGVTEDIHIRIGAGTEFSRMKEKWVFQTGINYKENLFGTYQIGGSGSSYRIEAGIPIGESWVGINAERIPYENGDVIGPYAKLRLEDTPLTIVGGPSYRLNADVDECWGGSIGMNVVF